MAALGFSGLAIAWIYSAMVAYVSVRNGDIHAHQYWMIRSYALCFAAVTLRIWIPLSQVAQLDFIFAYRIISWLCWLPNLILAQFIIHNLKKQRLTISRPMSVKHLG